MANIEHQNNGQPKKPTAPPAPPPSGVGEALSGAGTNVHDTGESLTKAKDTLKDLVNGKANVVDAAMAVKGAFDSVKGLTGKISESLMMPVMKALGPFKGQATLPAVKQMDPVMGVDVHMVTIPPSPAPVPMPHPYIGILFNPKDFVAVAINTFKKDLLDKLPAPAEGDTSMMASVAKNKEAIVGIAMGLAGLSATVKFGDFIPRAVTGTPTKNVPHIPMGAGFHPAFAASVAKNHGKAFLGSLFVAADGDPMCGSFHMHYDCWDIGVVDLFKGQRAGGKKSPEPGSPQAQLYVPSGVMTPIPIGRPVLVNSIPTPINPLSIADKVFKAGLGKLKKAASSALHNAINKAMPPGRLANAAHKAACIATGHPVDVASGMLFTDEEDFSLPGVIPFSFERTWYSDSVYNGPLGNGWHHEYDIIFTIAGNLGLYRSNDGKVISFDLPEPGKFSFDRKSKLFLHCHKEDKYYFISDKEGLIYRFTNKSYLNPYTNVNCQLLQSISNANGYSIRFEYNDKAHLILITDTAGRKLVVENDYNGRLKTIFAPDPRQASQNFEIAKYVYDDQGNMVCHEDALGQKMYYEYQNRLLIREIWRDGQQWHFRYDGVEPGSKCIHTWGPANVYNHKLTYLQGITVVENSLGYKTTYYIKGGLISKKIDQNNATWEYNYNRNDELEWETDPLGNQQTYTHDQWGNIAADIDPAGGFSSIEYVGPLFPSLPTQLKDKAGGVWKWKYDGQGNLIEKINSLGAKTKYDYEDGLLIKITNAADAVTQLKYDKDQNLIAIQTDDGATTEYLYDVLGHCTRITNPNNVSQRRAFDLKGRVEKISDFDGNIIDLEYDAIDNITRYRDKQKEIKCTYSGLWKLTSRSEGKATIIFKYDTEEQLRKIINEQGLPYCFELDAAGNVIEEIGFDDITRRYERNAAGWVTQIKRPAGKFKKYGYDAAGRVTEVEYSDAKKQTYTYRPDGELIQAVNDAAIVQFERDVRGNILKENINGEWIASEYDVFGKRVKISSSLGANITQQYNKMGDVLQMEANGWQAKFEHDKLGLETNRFLPGGIITQWQRDSIGRPVEQTVGLKAGNSFSNRNRKQYQWDVNDRLKQIRDEKGITRFEHDVWSNLAKTIYPNGEQQLRNPDAVGNLFKTDDQKDRVYAKGSQLKKSEGWQYNYDAEGNLVDKKHFNGDTWIYEWKDTGTLSKVIRPDKSAVTFTYDALGRRLSKQYKNTITKFVWDGNVPLHEWKEHVITGEKLSDINVGDNGIVTWLFDTDGFAPAGKIKGDKKYSIVADHLGTPNQMFKEDGTLFWECELDSYGKIRIEKGDLGSCPFRYQGQYEDDETGLYYNRFRYYSVNDGVYISQDPIRLNGGVLNIYGYCKDTNILIDPLGLATYTAASHAHILSSKHDASSPLKKGKSRFLPGEGGQNFTNEVINRATAGGPGVRITHDTDPTTGNTRTVYEVDDMGRQTGHGRTVGGPGFVMQGQPVRGGRVVVEGNNPQGVHNPGDVVTQHPL